MVICTIVSDKIEELETLKVMRDQWMFHVATPDEPIRSELPTLIYGRKLAQDIYGKHIDVMGEQGAWSYNELEVPSRDWLNMFAIKEITNFFDQREIGIDTVFEDFDVDILIDKLRGGDVFIHRGKYEMYFGTKSKCGIDIYSLMYSNLEYSGIDSIELFHKVINSLEGKCIVYTTDEFDFKLTKTPPMVAQDYIQDVTTNITELFDPMEDLSEYRIPSKSDIITIFMKSDWFSKMCSDLNQNAQIDI